MADQDPSVPWTSLCHVLWQVQWHMVTSEACAYLAIDIVVCTSGPWQKLCAATAMQDLARMQSLQNCAAVRVPGAADAVRAAAAEEGCSIHVRVIASGSPYLAQADTTPYSERNQVSAHSTVWNTRHQQPLQSLSNSKEPLYCSCSS